MNLNKFDKTKYILDNGKYDLDHLIYDVWKTRFFPSKMDMLPAIMTIGKGEFYSTIVMEHIENVLTNIDDFTKKYN